MGARRLDASVQASPGIVSQLFILLLLIMSLAGSGRLAAISNSTRCHILSLRTQMMGQDELRSKYR